MEYEYSIIVKDIDKYIDYCKKNKYVLKKQMRQERLIYRNDGNMARITKEYEVNGSAKLYLDFKEDRISNDDLIVRKESKTISFDNFENCENILTFLGYQIDMMNILDRTRIVYVKDDIKFEIDSYEKPKKCFVLAIEGKKEKVDEVYSELKERIDIDRIDNN